MRSGFRSSAAVVVSLVAASLTGACIFFVDEGAGGEGGAGVGGGGSGAGGAASTATSSAGGGGVGGAGVCTTQLTLHGEGGHPNSYQLVISPGDPDGVDLFVLNPQLQVDALKSSALSIAPFATTAIPAPGYINAVLSPHPDGGVLVANGPVTRLQYDDTATLVSQILPSVQSDVREAAMVGIALYGRLGDTSLHRLDTASTIEPSGVLSVLGYGEGLVWASSTGRVTRCAGEGCNQSVFSELSALTTAKSVDLGYAPGQRRYVALVVKLNGDKTLHTGTLTGQGESDAALLTDVIPSGEDIFDIAVGGEELFVLTDEALHVCSVESLTSDAPCCDSTGVIGGERIAAAEGIVVVHRFEDSAYHLTRYDTANAPGR